MNWTSSLGVRPFTTANVVVGDPLPRPVNQPAIVSAGPPVELPPPPLLTVPVISVLSITGASIPTQISTNPLLVKAAIIQNISVNPVTLGTIAQLVGGQGSILNPASTAGNAGGSATVAAQQQDNFIDLAHFWFVQSGTGATLSLWVLQ